jgi:hypothetical protein
MGVGVRVRIRVRVTPPPPPHPNSHPHPHPHLTLSLSKRMVIRNPGNLVEKRYDEETVNMIDDDTDNDGIDDDGENDDKDDNDDDDDIDDDADREVHGSCDDVNTNGFQETTQIQHANHLQQEAQLLKVDKTVQHSNSKGFTDDSATNAATKLEEGGKPDPTYITGAEVLPSDDEILRSTLATGPVACSTTAVHKLSVKQASSVVVVGRKLSGGLAVSFPSGIPFITPLCHTFACSKISLSS